MNKNSAMFWGLILLVLGGFAVAPYLVFVHAPTSEQLGGFIQKIFYFHVPCAWAMFLAALLAAVGGGATLFGGRAWGARLCASCSELAVMFGVIVLVTGPLWGKKAWGHYWVWDVRLTTVLILFLTFVAVLLARRYAGPARDRISAGLALFGAANIPLVYVSVNLWRGQHPKTTYVGSLGSTMYTAFFVSLALFTLLFVVLLWIRLNLAREQDKLDELAIALDERDQGASR